MFTQISSVVLPPTPGMWAIPILLPPESGSFVCRQWLSDSNRGHVEEDTPPFFFPFFLPCFLPSFLLFIHDTGIFDRHRPFSFIVMGIPYSELSNTIL